MGHAKIRPRVVVISSRDGISFASLPPVSRSCFTRMAHDCCNLFVSHTQLPSYKFVLATYRGVLGNATDATKLQLMTFEGLLLSDFSKMVNELPSGAFCFNDGRSALAIVNGEIPDITLLPKSYMFNDWMHDRKFTPVLHAVAAALASMTPGTESDAETAILWKEMWPKFARYHSLAVPDMTWGQELGLSYSPPTLSLKECTKTEDEVALSLI